MDNFGSRGTAPVQSPYVGLFSSWADVQYEFEKSVPEPEEVLLAVYEYESYDGNALVIYRNGDRYYWVEGGHCSCYGLEGQWRPEEFTKEELVAAIERIKSYGYGLKHQFADRILTALKA